MKVIINACFGGFSLSKAAVLWLAERGHAGAIKEKADMDAKAEKWRGVAAESKSIDYFEQKMANAWDADDGKGNPNGARNLFGYSWHVYEEDGLPRHDPLLIACVEALGGDHRQGASGPCAQLKVVEIPDGTEYQIEEYDGNEHVAEKHQTWA